MLLQLIILIPILIILIPILIITNNNKLKQTFNTGSFLKQLDNYEKVLLCGNSSKFNESFKNVQNPDDAFIIRFNSVLEHLPEDSKTDLLFISNDVYNTYDKSKIRKWNKKCKVCLIDDLLREHEDLFVNYPPNLTSGMSVLLFLINYINPDKIILVGFDMVNNYNESANWYGNTLWTGHDINIENGLLNEILSKNNITKY